MLKQSSIVILYVTASNKEEGQKIADDLVAGKLVACCNMVDPVHSTFSWQGAISREQEVMLILKSR